MLVYLQLLQTEDDREKFSVIYSTYKGLMYHVAFEILQNEQDAEDAVGNAFVKVCENFEKIGEPVCPQTKSFLVMVTESRAIDIYRRKNRFEMVSFEDAMIGVSYDLEEMDELVSCLAVLPARHREVMILKYRHNMESKEIGKLLGLSADNVRQIEKRATDKLKEIYGQEGSA